MTSTMVRKLGEQYSFDMTCEIRGSYHHVYKIHSFGQTFLPKSGIDIYSKVVNKFHMVDCKKPHSF